VDKWTRGCEGVWLGLRDVGEGILVEEVDAVVRFVLVMTKMKGRVRQQSLILRREARGGWHVKGRL
jgi:hypothetical protein